MNREITIDGSEGEGGGQIVRSSMALAVVTSRPLRLVNIRARRGNPGLQRQHVTAVKAAAEICGGQLRGAELRSGEIRFEPGQLRGGEYHFRVSTAGSAMLVLQTVLPPLLTADTSSRLTLEGGTHNQWAPPYDFLAQAYLPLIRRMGVSVHSSIQRYGFFPAGNGQVQIEIEPTRYLAGFDLESRGRIVSRKLTALIARLPEHVGHREVGRAARKLDWPATCAEVREVDSVGPGNALIAEVGCQQVTELFTAFGQKGLEAEKVADNLVRQVRVWTDSGVPVGEHLADQILLPLGLSAAQPPECGAQRGGSFRTLPLSQHSKTHIDILQRFLDIRIDVEGDGPTRVTVSPRA